MLLGFFLLVAFFYCELVESKIVYQCIAISQSSKPLGPMQM